MIKGYQGRSGRAIPVLKAILKLKGELQSHQIVIFGADPELFRWVNQTALINWDNFKIFGKITHNEVLKLMGKSKIYIGNSNSDGMPNTLLEAICMDVFPIQSNPGGVTEEIILSMNDGYLISDCENEYEIKEHILKAIQIKHNHIDNIVSKKYSFYTIKNKVLDCYYYIINI